MRPCGAARFDEAWLLPNSFRAALLAFGSGARRRIGYVTDRRGALLTDGLPAPSGTAHQLRDYDALLAAHGIAPDEDPPRLALPGPAARRAEAALAAAGLDGGAGSSRSVPGSAFAATKRWPAERYAALADALAGRGLPCVVLIGPGERELGARVAASARGRAPGARRRPRSGRARGGARPRALRRHERLGPHASGRRGRHARRRVLRRHRPGRTGPSGSPSRVLDRYVFCSPCFRTECPYGHECMKEIGVGDAVAAVMELTGTVNR